MKRKQLSTRVVAMLFVGICLALFVILFFGILYTNLPTMLRQAENQYLQKQQEVVEGVFKDAKENTFLLSADVAVWEDTVSYAKGDFPDFIEATWNDASLLGNYRFNYVFIKDTQGNDLYVEGYDYLNGQPLPVQEGLSDYLDTYATQTMEKVRTLPAGTADFEELGREGVVFYEGQAYLVGIMPILPSQEGRDPAGTVVLGTLLTEDYLRGMTHFSTASFKWIQDPEAEPLDTQSQGDYTVSDIPMEDIEGNPITLRISSERTIFLEGRVILTYTSVLLAVVVAALGVALYFVITRFFVRPLETLSRDIVAMDSSGKAQTGVDQGAYEGNRELYSLAGSINALLHGLQESNISLEAMQSILDGVDAYICVSDPDTDEILFVNEGMKERCNTVGDVVGEYCWQVFYPGRSTRCEDCPSAWLKEHPGEEVNWDEEDPISGKFFKNTDRMIDWAGQQRAFLHLKMDITSVRQAQVALKKRLDQQELMSAMSQGFLSTEPISQLIMHALEMTGSFMQVSKIILASLDEKDQVARFDYEWYNPEEHFGERGDRAPVFKPGVMLYDALITAKVPYLACEDVSQLKSGTEEFEKGGVKAFIAAPLLKAGRESGFLIFDDCTGPRCWDESDIQLVRLVCGVISGVLERDDTEKKLRQMSSIVNSSPQYITFLDEAYRFAYVNPGASVITGYTYEELLQGGMKMLMAEEVYDAIIHDLMPRIKEENQLDFEASLYRKDGEERIMRFSVFTAGGEIDGGVGCIGVDITERRRLEQDLVAAREKAEQSSLAKSEFLSRMSHEMRTPLNAVIGMTSIAKSSGDIDRKDYCLEKIDEASIHLLGVVNDVLDMSKIEAGKFELSYTDFEFEKMLQHVIDVMDFRIHEKKQEFLLKQDWGIPAVIYSDEQRLTQVLVNLMSNAVKFTPVEGSIVLTVSLLEAKDELYTLQFNVRDTGIGISEEQQKKLFRSFEQADGGISRKYGGTGLGLAISKNIVVMMGGQIWVESKEGEGSEFIFRVPVKKGRHKAVGEPPAVRLSNVRVLAVDDEPMVCEYFQELGRTAGFPCDVALNAQEAMALVEGAQEPYNIIFIDWRMPQTDGIQLSRMIREKFGDGVVIIMISATGWDEIEQDARQAGVDGYIPKPLLPSIVVNCINRYLAPEIVHEKEEAEVPPDCLKGKRLLLAEDVELNQEILMAVLEDTGVEIECAQDGAKAVEMFQEKGKSYDLILMDIHMPGMDGYEATRRIRAMDDAWAREIPIIAMTANVFREDVERCLAAGMNGHLGKPIDLGETLKTLQEYLC